jgi:hypothetical protein
MFVEIKTYKKNWCLFIFTKMNSSFAHRWIILLVNLKSFDDNYVVVRSENWKIGEGIVVKNDAKQWLADNQNIISTPEGYHLAVAVESCYHHGQSTDSSDSDE